MDDRLIKIIGQYNKFAMLYKQQPDVVILRNNASKLKENLVALRPSNPIVSVMYPCPGKPDVEIIAYGTALHLDTEDCKDDSVENGLGKTFYRRIKLKVKNYCQDDKKIIFNLDEQK